MLDKGIAPSEASALTFSDCALLMSSDESNNDLDMAYEIVLYYRKKNGVKSK